MKDMQRCETCPAEHPIEEMRGHGDVYLCQKCSDDARDDGVITLPPEMLPRVRGGEVAIVCPSCGEHWRPEQDRCPKCGRGIDETVN